MTRVVFMGTPVFAVPSLEALVQNGYEVAGVFTQPDRPVGRGRKIAACPVKQRAAELGLPVFQFERIRWKEGVEALKSLSPDVMVTAAFGQILTQEILDIPRHGTVNVHASLLPAHRGPAPVNWAILNGEDTTGVTTMLTDAGIDTGKMLLSASTPIGAEETADELTLRLSHIGAELLVRTLEGYLSGRIIPVPQPSEGASYDPMLTKEMGLIDWRSGARSLVCRVRGLSPWPGTYTETEQGQLKIWAARECASAPGSAPGTVLAASAKEGLIVACGDGSVELTEIQAPGGKRMQAKAYLAGRSIPVGTVFGNGKGAEA